jgi:hypothetical protein
VYQADQETERQVKTVEGEELARKWNSSFYETSARTGHNIHEVFAGMPLFLVLVFVLVSSAHTSIAL